MNCTAPLVLVRSNYLKGEAIKQKIIDHVETELKRVDMHNETDPEIIKFICDVIENSVHNKKQFLTVVYVSVVDRDQCLNSIYNHIDEY